MTNPGGFADIDRDEVGKLPYFFTHMKGMYADAAWFFTQDPPQIDFPELHDALVNAHQAGESAAGSIDQHLQTHGDRAADAVRILTNQEENNSGSLGGGHR